MIRNVQILGRTHKVECIADNTDEKEVTFGGPAVS